MGSLLNKVQDLLRKRLVGQRPGSGLIVGHFLCGKDDFDECCDQTFGRTNSF